MIGLYVALMVPLSNVPEVVDDHVFVAKLIKSQIDNSVHNASHFQLVISEKYSQNIFNDTEKEEKHWIIF